MLDGLSSPDLFHIDETTDMSVSFCSLYPFPFQHPHQRHAEYPFLQLNVHLAMRLTTAFVALVAMASTVALAAPLRALGYAHDDSSSLTLRDVIRVKTLCVS